MTPRLAWLASLLGLLGPIAVQAADGQVHLFGCPENLLNLVGQLERRQVQHH